MKHESFLIPGDGSRKPVQCERVSPPGRHPTRLIFTHGAGGGLAAPAMLDFTEAFATLLPIINFKGSMNLTARVSAFQRVIDYEFIKPSSSETLAIGGRSMGSRAAIMARPDHVKTLVLVSYPLYSDKGDNRQQLLLDIPNDVDVLFIVGNRDTMCPLKSLQEARTKMVAKSWLVELCGADHGMKTRHDATRLRRLTGVIAAEWLDSRDELRQYRTIGCGPDPDREPDENLLDSGWQ